SGSPGTSPGSGSPDTSPGSCSPCCTTTVTRAAPKSPWPSTTVAVTTRIPDSSWSVVMLCPAPSGSSSPTVHTMPDDRSAPAASVAVAVKTTGVPSGTVRPLAGEVIVTVGPPDATVTSTVDDELAPSESVTVAVSRWGPDESTTVGCGPSGSGSSSAVQWT